MKTIRILLLGLVLVGFVVSAQTLTNDAPPVPGGAVKEFPTTRQELWQAAIMIITPVIVLGISKIPKLPRPVLPIIAPILGVILGQLLKLGDQANLPWWDSAAAGGLAVWLRETVNQTITKQFKPLEESKTDAKPVDNAVAVEDPTKAISRPRI